MFESKIHFVCPSDFDVSTPSGSDGIVAAVIAAHLVLVLAVPAITIVRVVRLGRGAALEEHEPLAASLARTTTPVRVGAAVPYQITAPGKKKNIAIFFQALLHIYISLCLIFPWPKMRTRNGTKCCQKKRS